MIPRFISPQTQYRKLRPAPSAAFSSSSGTVFCGSPAAQIFERVALSEIQIRNTLTYDILMDTGLFKRGVQAEAIRVKEGAKPPPAFRGPSLALAQLGS